MKEYEERVRKWLADNGQNELAEKIPFFRDGITNPEKWFSEGNNFRPLFILKEVSLGKDKIKDVNLFLEEWGNQRTFEFVENLFDDVKIGKFTLWRKIAALSKGLEEIYNGAVDCEYRLEDFAYMSGGEKYTGDIKGYKEYKARTANSLYNEVIDKIAILEVKKIGGGRDAKSELSLATRHYTEHIGPFEDLICREIELINPTVVVCCSHEFFTCKLLDSIKEKVSLRPWIYGYHPTMSTIENFYEKPLQVYKEYLQSV